MKSLFGSTLLIRSASSREGDRKSVPSGSQLAGAFLSQIGNVGPSLGQSYIVDAFMTVVVGGVGSIVGTVCSAIGIGTADQILQQATGSPVTGKIVVLVAIILFLQWRPGGLFSIRSRSLD